MIRKHILCVSVLLSACAFVTSCATTDSASVAKITEHKDAYKSKGTAALSNDIKSILMAGGLNTADPAAPTGSVQIADVTTAKDAKSSEVAALVASLSADPGKTTALQTPSVAAPATQLAVVAPVKPEKKPAPVAVAAKKPEPAKTPALALVAEPKHEVIEETYQFVDIGVDLKPGEKLPPPSSSAFPILSAIPEAPAAKAPVATASVDNNKKTSRPKSAVVYAKPSVQRF